MTLSMTAMLAACATQTGAVPSPPAARTTPSTAAVSSAAPEPATDQSADLSASFDAMSRSIPAAVGLAVTTGLTVRIFGIPSDGPAWSTIKVPLAVAALRSSPEQAREFTHAAITRSDNDAAEALWELLGPPPEAAQAVQAVLRETGDETTKVEMNRLRAGFTAFGQTRWPLDAQARFASQLPCVAGAQPVIDEMRNLVPDQRWAMAQDGQAATKGGWGPQPDGNYLVRQIASITEDSGTIGVAISALPDDGSFGSGVAALTEVAQWVLDHLDAFGSDTCRHEGT